MEKKNAILPVLTTAAAVLALLSIVVFTLVNKRNVSNNNREYLKGNTGQMAVNVVPVKKEKITIRPAAYPRQVTAGITWTRCREIPG